jgi:putative MATE family efflux protein
MGSDTVKEDITLEKPKAQFKTNLLSGSITKNILTLALPILVANFIANAYFIIDMIFVGRLGPTALAAVSLGGVLMSFTWTILLGLSIATSSLVARYYGANNAFMVARVTVQSLVIIFFVSVLLALFGLFGVQHVLALMGTEDAVLGQAVVYSRITFCGAISMLILFIVNSVFRGTGDVKIPMISLGISSIINIILDPLLIFGLGPFPELGVKGAAIATVIGQTIGAAINMYVLYYGLSRIKIAKWPIKPDLKLLKTQIFIAVPGGLQNLFQSISTFVIMRFVAAYGTFAVAAYGIGMRLDIMVMLPGWALGASVATVLGQNLGAKQPDRAEKAAWRGSQMYFIVLAVFCCTLWFGADIIISTFNNTPEVVEFGTSYIHTVVFGYLLLSLFLIMTMAMNGAGYTVIPMIISAAIILGFRLPAAVVFSKYLNWGTNGIWAAIAVSFILQAILSTIWFAKGKWKLKKYEGE